MSQIIETTQAADPSYKRLINLAKSEILTNKQKTSIKFRGTALQPSMSLISSTGLQPHSPKLPAPSQKQTQGTLKSLSLLIILQDGMMTSQSDMEDPAQWLGS